MNRKKKRGANPKGGGPSAEEGRVAHGHSNISKASARKAREFEAASMPYVDGLYRHGLSLTRNKADAEDLVQEAYLKAFRAFESFETGTNLRAWLFKILTNTFFTLYQKQKRSEAIEERIREEPGFSFYAAANQERENSPPEGLTPEPILQVESLETVLGDEVTLALDQIADEYRQTLLLSDVQDFSYQEIASILDIPIGTVRSRLFRARSLLQKSLWEYAKDKGLWRREGA